MCEHAGCNVSGASTWGTSHAASLAVMPQPIFSKAPHLLRANLAVTIGGYFYQSGGAGPTPHGAAARAGRDAWAKTGRMGPVAGGWWRVAGAGGAQIGEGNARLGLQAPIAPRLPPLGAARHLTAVVYCPLRRFAGVAVIRWMQR
jgi:hypothetical protein